MSNSSLCTLIHCEAHFTLKRVPSVNVLNVCQTSPARMQRVKGRERMITDLTFLMKT